VFNNILKLKQHIHSNFDLDFKKRGKYNSVILQKYIVNPLLINRRKFDIRVFALLVVHVETKSIRGYYFEEGYMRTSCKEFNLNNIESRFVHLTNDAV
jgi:tubulin--tyrosine ligase